MDETLVRGKVVIDVAADLRWILVDHGVIWCDPAAHRDAFLDTILERVDSLDLYAVQRTGAKHNDASGSLRHLCNGDFNDEDETGS